METFKYYFNKTIITLCILFFFVLWYQILSTILCSVFCEVEPAEVVIAYEDMTPEQRRAEFEKLKAQRIAENEKNSSTTDITDNVNISSSR
jgi:hypothetical protein